MSINGVIQQAVAADTFDRMPFVLGHQYEHSLLQDGGALVTCNDAAFWTAVAENGAYGELSGTTEETVISLTGEGLLTCIIGPASQTGGQVFLTVEVDGEVVGSVDAGGMIRPVIGSALAGDGSESFALGDEAQNGYGGYVYKLRFLSPWYALASGAPVVRFKESLRVRARVTGRATQYNCHRCGVLIADIAGEM